MRTLTEKYNAVLEGNFSKSQFVRDARLSHPNFITQFTSYEDAVKILKNKSLIHENNHQEDELNLPPTTIDKAIKYELEKAGVDYLMAGPDTEDYLKARNKALKALAKDRLYYLELNTSKKKRTDLMEPATSKNTVDKANGLQKAQIKETINFKDISRLIDYHERTGLLPRGMSQEEYERLTAKHKRSTYGKADKDLPFRGMTEEQEDVFSQGFDPSLAFALHKAITRTLKSTGNTFEQEWPLATSFGYFVNSVMKGDVRESVNASKSPSKDKVLKEAIKTIIKKILAGN